MQTTDPVLFGFRAETGRIEDRLRALKKGIGNKEGLKRACQGFEAIFIEMMLKEMRRSVPKGGLFPDTIQKDIYTSLFDQQVAREMAEGKGIGLSDMLYKNLNGKTGR